MKSLKTISDEITVLEAERDFGDITPEGLELLAALNLCYDLLSRTKTARAIQVPQPEEMKEPGFDDEFINKYGVMADALADFAFAIATKQGPVDLRDLLKQLTWRNQSTLAAAIGIRPATLSDYLNGKTPFNCDSYQQIINKILEEFKNK